MGLISVPDTFVRGGRVQVRLHSYCPHTRMLGDQSAPLIASVSLLTGLCYATLLPCWHVKGRSRAIMVCPTALYT